MADTATPAARNPLFGLGRLAARRLGRARIQGFVDSVVRGDTVVGWARDPRDPARRLEVQLLHDDEVVGFGVANLPRKDLLAQDMGDGRYGFQIRLGPALLDGATRTITVAAVTDRGKVPLQRGTLTVSANQPGEPTSRAGTGLLVGALERLSGRALHGWAYNPDHPDAPASVDIYDDEHFLGSVMADRSRPRLYEKGFPSGARGFVFELPAGLAPGAADRLRARVSGTAHELRRARDFKVELPADERQEAVAPASANKTSAPDALPAAARRATRPTAKAEPTVTLWLAAGPGDAAMTRAGWAEQLYPHVRLVNEQAGAPLDQVASGGGLVLLTPSGTVLDPALAGALARHPGLPDVIVVDGERPAADGDAARAAILAAPARARTVAVRADLLAGLPGLAGDLAAGLLSPLLLWLATRDDLLWGALAPPGIGRAEEPGGERRAARWRAVLDAATWEIGDDAVLPRAAPARLSIGVWRGWDEPGLPALAAIVAGLSGPLDILVPAGRGSDASNRLAAAEAMLGPLNNPAARARLVDGAEGDMATIRAMMAGADGDVLLLSDGSVPPGPADLTRMARWCTHPRVGPVGLAQPNWSSGLRIGADELLGREPDAGVVDAVSFGLLAIATGRAAIVPPPEDGSPDDVALMWGHRLARYGFSAMTVAGRGASSAQSPAPLALPWPVRALLRAEGWTAP